MHGAKRPGGIRYASTEVDSTGQAKKMSLAEAAESAEATFFSASVLNTGSDETVPDLLAQVPQKGDLHCTRDGEM